MQHGKQFHAANSKKEGVPYYSNLNKTHKETGLEVSIVFHSIPLEGENVA